MAPVAKKPAAAPKPPTQAAKKTPVKTADKPKKINAKKAAKPAAKPQLADKKQLAEVKGGTYKTETTLNK